MADAGRNSYDTAASGEVQAKVKQLNGQITALITQHEANVKAALSDATASGVTESYRQVEGKFSAAAKEVLNIIRLLTSTMEDNDAAAAAALRQAQASVDAIPGG